MYICGSLSVLWWADRPSPHTHQIQPNPPLTANHPNTCVILQDWLWPAIWLLPEKNAYGQWPASGEIDLMESRGNKPGYVKGAW